MPRIHDQYLDSVVYLYRSRAEAQEGINAGGSGFLLSMRSSVVPAPGGFLYAVTNRHVVKEGGCTVRLNTSDGGMDVFSFPKERWICSEEDDLAVCLMPNISGAIFKYLAVPFEMLLSKERADAQALGPGDEVFLVGRFINRDGVQKNTPSVRFGCISQMPGEPVDGQESFLAEVHSIGGYSGSPVFLYPVPNNVRPDKAEPIGQCWLLGVDWGHMKRWVPVCGRDQKSLGNHMQVEGDTGMAVIVPAWKLKKFLESDPVRKRRKEGEEDYLRAKKSSVATADFSTEPAEKATDANPRHREDFNSLVGAAARKQQQDD